MFHVLYIYIFGYFDGVNRLSFNAKRLTLQQLFEWARHFRRFLLKGPINTTMKEYTAILTTEDGGWTSASLGADKIAKIQKFNEKLPTEFEKFKKTYFGDLDEKQAGSFLPEVRWLFENIEYVQDLCKRIYPFWGGRFISSIYNFMESTEQIQGNYELKCAEFGQLKYSLNVNAESATKLFHIIRFKQRSLSWQQIYQYLDFVLRMKYNVQKAILNSKQAEDTTVSNDGMKILLNISLNDASHWLFEKVLFFNGSKVTWKQIMAYLKKSETVRDEVRDIFAEKERCRKYQENTAEVIGEIAKSVDESQGQNKHIELMEMLKEIQKQNYELKQEVSMLKRRFLRSNSSEDFSD